MSQPLSPSELQPSILHNFNQSQPTLSTCGDLLIELSVQIVDSVTG